MSARRAFLFSAALALLSHAAAPAVGAGALATVASALGCAERPARAPLASAPADWNAREVAWTDYAAGLDAAKAGRKPLLLVFYTDWCPHCHNYSRLFHDPEVVRLSRQFVMVRVERDANPSISDVYAIDGNYIPRTFFLSPTGAVLTDLTSDNEEFRYFFDEHDSTELIALMQRALQRLGPAEPAGE